MQGTCLWSTETSIGSSTMARSTTSLRFGPNWNCWAIASTRHQTLKLFLLPTRNGALQASHIFVVCGGSSFLMPLGTRQFSVVTDLVSSRSICGKDLALLQLL